MSKYKEYQKKWMEEHQEYMKEWRKNYRIKNKEKIKKYSKKYHKEYYNNNIDEIKEKSKQYRKEHKEEIKQWKKKYRIANKEMLNFKDRQKRYKRESSEGSHTLGEWELLKKQYGYRCPYCGGKEPFDQDYKYLTEDHIIPLSKGGSDYIENIQPLCKRCNNIKYTKKVIFKVK